MPKWPFLVLALLIIGAVGATAGVAAYTYNRYESYTKDISNPADIISKDQGPAIVYDRDGNFL
jgi:hypothetical protein